MPPRSLLRVFFGLWVISGFTLLYTSTVTVREAWTGSHADPHVAVLGGIEAVAALLFVLPATVRFGAAGLLATLAVAFAAHLVAGELRADLLVYAAVVTFVGIHGPLTRAQFRAAISRPAV